MGSQKTCLKSKRARSDPTGILLRSGKREFTSKLSSAPLAEEGMNLMPHDSARAWKDSAEVKMTSWPALTRMLPTLRAGFARPVIGRVAIIIFKESPIGESHPKVHVSGR